jgi:hypothetical protein
VFWERRIQSVEWEEGKRKGDMSEIAIERATTDDVSSKYLDTASSGDLFQKVTSQLVGVFRARGCTFPIAEEMAQNVTEELRARVGEVLRRPGS